MYIVGEDVVGRGRNGQIKIQSLLDLIFEYVDSYDDQTDMFERPWNEIESTRVKLTGRDVLCSMFERIERR